MKLHKLVISNFKGIEDLVIKPDGKNVTIYGCNGAGKTTILDALWWLLFHKNSQEKSDFKIKRLYDGTVLDSKAEIVVEAVFEHNGNKIEFKKAMIPEYTFEGTYKEELKGNPCKYFIDSLPKKKKEYDDEVSAMFPPNIDYKVLLNPFYFGSILKPNQRKDILFTIFKPEITESELLETTETLKPLIEKKGQYTVKKYSDICTMNKGKLDERIKEIPKLITELKKSISDKTDIKAEQDEIAKLETLLQEQESILITLKSGTSTQSIKNKIAEKKNALTTLSNKAAEHHRTQVTQYNQEKDSRINAIKVQINDLTQQNLNLVTLVANLTTTEKSLIEQKASLLKEYNQLKTLTFNEQNTCPSCGQKIPLELIQNAKEQFNLKKANDMAKNIEQGKGIKAEIEKISTEIEENKTASTEIQEKIEQLNLQINGINNEAHVFSKLEGYTEQKEALEKEIADLTKQLEESKKSEDTQTEPVQTEINRLKTEINKHNSLILQSQQQDKAKQRIKELEAERNEKVAEIDKINADLALCSQYEKELVYRLEQNVNKHFEYAKIKLFDDYDKNEFYETCEVMCNGTHYDVASTSEKINYGIDVINTIAGLYNSEVPIIIDNAESVTEFTHTDQQLITLKVPTLQEIEALNITNDNKLAIVIED